jgi:hypothetical protein
VDCIQINRLSILVAQFTVRPGKGIFQHVT